MAAAKKSKRVKPASLGDDRLLALVAKGDSRAWGEIVNRHADAAYALALRMLQNQQDAEDALQETFLRIRNSAKTFTYGSDARSWITKIAAREALKMINKRKRNHQRHASLSLIGEESVAAESPAQKGRAEKMEVSGLLAKAMDTLPEKLRVTLALHFGANMNQTEIADELECDQSTISHRIKKGLSLLRKKLAAAGVGGGALALAPIDMTNCFTLSATAPASAIAKLHAIGPSTIASASSVKAVAVTKTAGLSKIVIAATFVAAVGITGIVINENMNPELTPQKTVEPVLVPAAVKPKKVADKPERQSVKQKREWKVLREFDFSNGIPDGLLAFPNSKDSKGMVRLNKKKKKSMFCIENGCYGFLFKKPIKVNTLPIVVEIYINTNISMQFSIDGAWNEDKGTTYFKLHEPKMKNGGSFTMFNTSLTRLYITGDSYQKWYTDGRNIKENGILADVRFMEPAKDNPLLCMLVVLQSGKSLFIDRIKVYQVDKSDVPDISRFRKALDTVPLDRRVGSYTIPAKDSPYPGKAHKINFESAQIRIRRHTQQP